MLLKLPVTLIPGCRALEVGRRCQESSEEVERRDRARVEEGLPRRMRDVQPDRKPVARNRRLPRNRIYRICHSEILKSF